MLCWPPFPWISDELTLPLQNPSPPDDDENGSVDYGELVTFVYDLLDHLDREDYIRHFQDAAADDDEAAPPAE